MAGASTKDLYQPIADPAPHGTVNGAGHEEVCLEWGSDDVAQVGATGAACAWPAAAAARPKPKVTPIADSKKPLIIAIATLLISIPALVGSWCWPLLLAALIGVAASEAAKALAHSLTFGVTMAAITNVAQFVGHGASRRKGSHIQRYGPLYLSCLSVPFIMADLTRHVLQDSNVWPAPGSSMYNPDGSLSMVGWLFSIVCTYIGFALLMVGVMWSVDIVGKIQKQWQSLRDAAASK